MMAAEELPVMRGLPPTRLSDYEEVDCRVSSHSTIRVKKVTYSVPARQFLCLSAVVTLVEPAVDLAVYDARLGGEVAHGA